MPGANRPQADGNVGSPSPLIPPLPLGQDSRESRGVVPVNPQPRGALSPRPRYSKSSTGGESPRSNKRAKFEDEDEQEFQRRVQERQSERDRLLSQSSDASEDWIPSYNATQHPSFAEAMTAMDSMKVARMKTSPRKTLFAQSEIAQKIPMPVRMCGIILAFGTIVSIWESTDLLVKLMFRSTRAELLGYFVLMAISGGGVLFTHLMLMQAESSLLGSFVYALFTLYAAIGGWGVLGSCVILLLPSGASLLVAWSALGMVLLMATLVYSILTKHNVLLDIASCALSLGLYDADPEDENDPRTALEKAREEWLKRGRERLPV